MQALQAQGWAGRVDVIHLDPPFGTELDFARVRDVPLADSTVTQQVQAYHDTMDLPQWLSWMRAVLAGCHQLLSSRGALYLHLDFRRAAYARLLLDELFGSEQLLNEIIWSYGLGGSSPRRFQRKHDVIALYAKDVKKVWFQAPRQVATSIRMRGQSKAATDVWQTADTAEDAAIVGAWPDDLVEKTMTNMDKERTGYPTQKPLALCARMVQASLPAGGVALDLMCGSGTFGVAAAGAGAEVLLADMGACALDVARARMLVAGHALTLERQLGSALQIHEISVQLSRQPSGQVGLAAVNWPETSTDLQGLGIDALVAWGLADGKPGLDGQAAPTVLAWWEGSAGRQRPLVAKSLAVAAPEDVRYWLGVDVHGAWWCAPWSAGDMPG